MTSDDNRPQRLVFGEVAEDYDRYRPQYPEEVFDRLVGDSGAEKALDIGAGTGRSAVALSARGMAGIAVEPDAAMAEVARRHLPETWSVEISDFERCAAGGHTDWALITCAQAWHWIDPDAGFAKASSLLQIGGHLALIWNRPTFNDDDLRGDLDRIYDDHAPDMPSSLRSTSVGSKGQDTIDTERPPDGFASVEMLEWWWERVYSRDNWLQLLNTHSDHRLLDPERRAALFTDIGDAIDDHGGAFTLPYRVEVLRFTR